MDIDYIIKYLVRKGYESRRKTLIHFVHLLFYRIFSLNYSYEYCNFNNKGNTKRKNI